jgi:hydrogenase maturation factor
LSALLSWVSLIAAGSGHRRRLDSDGVGGRKAYLPDTTVGEYTIANAGYAIARFDEKSAVETRTMFDDLGVSE